MPVRSSRPAAVVLMLAAAATLPGGSWPAAAGPVPTRVVDGVPTRLQPYGPTSAAPAGGTVGPLLAGADRWKYRGSLGLLEPAERLVDPVADPPTRTRGTAPLTGRPDESTAGRAVVVKIDNTARARPQVALNRADIVYEELVEAGLTRLAAVFHSSQPRSIGPVRSARSTDLGIVGSYKRPVFANSGANRVFTRLIARGPLVDRGVGAYPGAYWRSATRPVPHNLFTGATSLQAGLTASRPPAHFAYRGAGRPADRTAPTASDVRLRYLRGRGVSVRYEWSAASGRWTRWQQGSAHVDSNGAHIAARNVVVQIVEYADSGLTDKWGEVLYEAQLVGTGPALVFTDGRVFAATWTKPSLAAVTTFTDRAGRHVKLTRGRTWVSLVPPGGVTFDSPVCAGAIATVAGSAASETLIGTPRDDVIAAGAGDDVIHGKGGRDLICAGGGNDLVFAGGGRDLVRGGSGDDIVRGGDGKDDVRGNGGIDQVHGDRGADILRGGAGVDQLVGRLPEDRIVAGRSDLVLRGWS